MTDLLLLIILAVLFPPILWVYGVVAALYLWVVISK